MDCVWVIHSEDHVELTMVDMDLANANGDLCVFDSLTIYDGKSTNSGRSRISPRRGRQLPRGAPTCEFAKFSQKLPEIERIGTPGGASLAPPP